MIDGLYTEDHHEPWWLIYVEDEGYVYRRSVGLVIDFMCDWTETESMVDKFSCHLRLKLPKEFIL